VKSGSPIAIERQSSEENHTSNWIVGHADAGAREVVMHKALTLESSQ